jgi:hypothetical protein
LVRVSHVRLVLLIALVLTALFGQIRSAGAQGADATTESLDFSGCFPDHQFEVCAEITGVRHQIVTPSGNVITGFTEFSCFTITAFGEFVSERCQTEHNAELSEDGFLMMAHDSGQMEFTDGEQTCTGRFLFEVADGELVVSESDIECI